MKKLMIVISSLSFVMMFTFGCAYTKIVRNSEGVTGKRIAFLYPFGLGNLRITTSNEVWELNDYHTDGGSSNASAIAAAITSAAIKAAK